MPRYYLHCAREVELRRDYEGADFTDTMAALRNGWAAAGILIDEGIEVGEDRSGWRLIVTDDSGAQVADIPLMASIRQQQLWQRAQPSSRRPAYS